MKNQSFGKHVRICKRRDFLAVYQQGVRSHSENFTVIVSRNQTGISRLGVTVSKKVGNAVQRNRIKRLIREFFRLNRSRLSTPQDIIVIAKKDSSFMKYQDICSELESHLIKNPDA